MALNINGTTGISGVDGSVSAPAVTGTDSNTGITFPSADTIKFSTGGVERMSITNSGVSGITTGITMADQWRINAAGSMGSSPHTLTANWERNDNTGFTGIGSAMTQSSGIFSFPSTGIYYITAKMTLYGSSAQIAYIFFRTETTIDNSTYTISDYNAGASAYSAGTGVYFSVVNQLMFDVTDVSQCKVKFSLLSPNSGSTAWDGQNHQASGVTFIRLGDT